MLILASSSPRRRAMLAGAGIEFEVRPPEIDESVRPGESPVEFVERIAQEKAAAVAATVTQQWVLAADTIVVLDGEILGKPRDLDHARDMLTRLSGRTHHVLSGVCLHRHSPRHLDVWHADTAVTFRALSRIDVAAYMQRVDVLDKAGAYAIQEHGDRIVDRHDGLLSNVIGLPIEQVVERLGAYGRARG